MDRAGDSRWHQGLSTAGKPGILVRSGLARSSDITAFDGRANEPSGIAAGPAIFLVGLRNRAAKLTPGAVHLCEISDADGRSAVEEGRWRFERRLCRRLQSTALHSKQRFVTHQRPSAPHRNLISGCLE